jgi:hypothetical protein
MCGRASVSVETKLERSRCATPNFCCSSITTKPSRLKVTRRSSSVDVPMTRLHVPSFTSALIISLRRKRKPLLGQPAGDSRPWRCATFQAILPRIPLRPRQLSSNRAGRNCEGGSLLLGRHTFGEQADAGFVGERGRCVDPAFELLEVLPCQHLWGQRGRRRGAG